MSLKEKNINCDVVLYINIGTVNTRVSLFVRQSVRFEFVGAVSSRTLYNEVGEIDYASISGAVRKLERVTERSFMDDNERIIVPQKLGMIGADQVVVTVSAGDNPRIVLMGLTDNRSLQELRTLITNSGLRAECEICAMDGNSLTENLDKILNADPDLVIVAGGTDHGAERAVYRLGEILLLACKSIPRESRPRILYLGSEFARLQFHRVFAGHSKIISGENVLSTKHTPELNPSAALRTVVGKFLRDRSPALNKLEMDLGILPVRAEFAYGRAIRLFSRLTKEHKSTLGVDIGASRTITAIGRDLDLSMSISRIGMGGSIRWITGHFRIQELMRWLPFQMKDYELRDYIYNKSVHPELIPGNDYSYEIELLLARFALRKAIAEHPHKEVLRNGQLGAVVLSGSVLRNVSDPAEALRVAMDALRPAGAIDFFLDLHGLASAIGAMADSNRDLAAQLTSPVTFLNLGRVIAPISRVKEGRRIFSISVRDDGGSVQKYDIIQGSIKRIPLENGRIYEVNFYNIHEDVSIPGVKTWTPMSFRAGAFGLVFDMRPERLIFPKERAAQIHLLDRWKQELGSWKK